MCVYFLPDILFLAGNPGRGLDFAALVHVHGGAAVEEAERRWWRRRSTERYASCPVSEA